MSLKCQFPFGNLSIDEGGLAPCCWSSKLADFSEVNEDVYNSPSFLSLRNQLNSGAFPMACHLCRSSEEEGRVSLRQRMGQKLFENGSLNKSEQQSIRLLDITLDRVCPLACRMCSSVHSSSWDPVYDRLKQNQHRFSETAWSQISGNQLPSYEKSRPLMTRQPGFWKVIEQGLATSSAVNMTGGEPLIHPDHNKLIEKFEHSGIRHLIYHTSLNVSANKIEKLLSHWKRFESVTFKVSVDDINERYENFRLGGDFQKVLQNLEQLRNLPNVSLEINVVVQSWNVKDLREILLFWENTPDVSVNLKPVNGPELFRSTVLPFDERKPVIGQLQQILEEMDLSPINQDVLRSEIASLETEDLSVLYNDLKIYNEILGQCAPASASR